MVLAGLAFALAGWMPRDVSSFSWQVRGTAMPPCFVFGMIVGAGFAHNFGLASSPNGCRAPRDRQPPSSGLLVCLFIGFTMRRKRA